MKKILNTRKIKWTIAGIILTAAVCFSLLFYFYIIKDLPSPTRLVSASIPQSTQIFDRNNTLLYTIYSSKNQTFIPLSYIPASMQQAIISIEDKDFYNHGAIDIKGTVRAFISTVFKREIQGGSTITQQLVKNSLLTSERTIIRKIKEALLSFAAEALYSKKKILEMYLNQAPFGGTAWGIEAASQRYFGKSAKDLTLAQSALLAGLTEAPTAYSPQTNPHLAKQRQIEVLKKMYQQKYISKKQLDEAIKTPLTYQQISEGIKAPHFVLYVKELLVQKYGIKKVEQGGLKVITSLDLPTQEYAQATVSAEISKLVSFDVGNGATLITNPKTGEILAMVGSRDYFDTEHDGNVNVTSSLRQPGSAIKPINYAVGLIKGFTAASPFVDQKTCYPNPTGSPYCPVNYDGKFHGVMQMRFALANSINIPAVKMLKANGVSDMIATASAMGITSFTDSSRYGLSLTLGGGEVTMLELTTMYGVFANNGYRVDLHPILKVTDANGKVLEEYKPKEILFAKKILPEGVAFIISHILSDNGARELEFGPNSELKISNFPVSVKTGTTNDFRDNWTVGYTPDRVVAVWVGNNDNHPMSGLVSGVTGAAPIWHKLMKHMLEGTKPRLPVMPTNVIGKTICAASGLLPPEESTPDRCPTRFEYFIRGTQPAKVDPGRQKVLIDKATNDLAKPDQKDNVEEKDELVVTDVVGDRYCITCPHPE
ncbi:MAG: hypothetical protein A3F31_01720 [Candidatus Levybacteria bacterium RIFCSPHIGHO2_12_FULL_38_12]|nr:MAG: hypothetical protein A3D75_01850 [Candidatus Levybacteria bacterium RIFCSPHIGHO2_02_FULL_37_18]OGH22196.1 MAG: hypothetical protein A3F31_01720 [Candidatus Levybacteria bacterium RIFCSPHIGHO2_12_FULL_38_12]OGH34359.1 MAG: hypothetical protein A3A47_02080 [Candidatus Levybacteria bacterium RIFCSPLOWO2_01_FULL_37_20]OGH44241.1 MAG: hypothetical protein A3J14_01665 [Candidatus Levybacteria bacterium RIFCSPLOWO2_02_FULL_37_18]